MFNLAPWQLDDGPIYRSTLLDHRNDAYRLGTGPPGYTSLILDATRAIGE
jgi:predicted SAM-dependent methyltransferase